MKPPYRSPAEPPPRPNASGGLNVVTLGPGAIVGPRFEHERRRLPLFRHGVAGLGGFGALGVAAGERWSFSRPSDPDTVLTGTVRQVAGSQVEFAADPAGVLVWTDTGNLVSQLAAAPRRLVAPRLHLRSGWPPAAVLTAAGLEPEHPGWYWLAAYLQQNLQATPAQAWQEFKRTHPHIAGQMSQPGEWVIWTRFLKTHLHMDPGQAWQQFKGAVTRVVAHHVAPQFPWWMARFRGRIPMPPAQSIPAAGATSAVAQPLPFEYPVNYRVADMFLPSAVAAPAPTVGVSTSQTLPALTTPGTQLDAQGNSITTTAAPSSGILGWLEGSMFAGIPNWMLAAGAAGALLFMGKKGRR